jgi:uncharacterized oligopeptide transporter (OPT) family protein
MTDPPVPSATQDAVGAAAPPAEPVRDFTLRAVLAGVVLGGVLSMGNIYMGLKSNWWDSGNITAAILGFALCAPSARVRGQRYTLLENNITQTTAGSAAAMPATIGLLGALPALELAGHHYAWWELAAWGSALALFGILLAIPLRQRYVVGEPLTFPSGVATAEVMQAIHASSAEARTRTRIMLLAAAVALTLTWFRDGRPSVIPGVLWLPFSLLGVSGQALTLGLAISPALMCGGLLVGPRAGFSLLGGALVAWALLAPALVQAGIAEASYTSLVGWLLWPGMALMVSAGLTALALRWRSFYRSIADVGQLRRQPGTSVSWWALGAAAATVVLVGWRVFDVHPALGLASVLVSIALIDVCVRSVGETDIAPLGQLGQLGQLFLALVAPGKASVNVACASVAAGAGAQSAITVLVLKTGHILKAPPRAQIQAQLVGAVVGLLVSLPAYALLKKAYGIGTEQLPAPGALPWKALATLAETGTAAMPRWAAPACLVAIAAGIILALLERTRIARYVPSPIALAASFLIPAMTSVAIAIGAIVWLLLSRKTPSTAERFATSTAAGGIAGESIMAFTIGVLTALGVF